MSELHRYLIGYDPKTERVAVEYPIPSTAFSAVRRYVDAGRLDPEMITSYDLNLNQPKLIAAAIRVERLPANLDYFLEAFTE